MTAKPLEPADPNQCQCDVTIRPSPFTLGGDLRPKTARCTNVPVTIATELSPGADGQTGSMSLCAGCWAEMPKDVARRCNFAPIISEVDQCATQH